MRKVKLFKWEKIAESRLYAKVADGEGLFVQYGIDFEEVNDGVGSCTTAIIEMEDGTVRNMPLELIQFEKELTPLENLKKTMIDVNEFYVRRMNGQCKHGVPGGNGCEKCKDALAKGKG
jgi:hypothetical protein